MKWVLIRHGLTHGNLQHRYIGCRTDEPLCPEGIRALQPSLYPRVSHVFISPMLRCRETAQLLYPELVPEAVEDFRECDFGAFENLSYQELNGREDYQRWLDSAGELPFPGGESREAFATRCIRAFENLPAQQQDCALIVHGGTIMAIMEAYARPHGTYFDFQVSCGAGYILETDGCFSPLSTDPKA